MKIVVMNLEDAVERRLQVVAGLEELGLDFEIYQAIDGRNLTSEHRALIDVNGAHRDGLPISMGSVANWLSQRDIFIDLVKNGPDIMAIFEDDAAFSQELPSVLNAIEGSKVPFGIVFLHRGPRKRRFVPNHQLTTGHWLGWVRFSHYGTQGYVITREAARQFLARNPLVRSKGFDRALARYWHHGLMTYCLHPPVVFHLGTTEDCPSMINAMPGVEPVGPFWRLRRYRYDVREGVGKRLAFARLMIESRGLLGGCREFLGLRPNIRHEDDSRN